MTEPIPPKNNTLATAVTIAAVIGSIAGPMYVMLLGQAGALGKQQEELTKLRDQLVGPQAALTERVEGLITAVTELDRTLQLEITALGEKFGSDLEGLDRKLQGEILAADKESAGRHDTQEEKLRSLERVVFPKQGNQ